MIGTSMPISTPIISTNFPLAGPETRTCRSNSLDPFDESINVVEQLGDDEVSASVDLLCQKVNVRFGSIRVNVRGRITCEDEVP